MSGFALQWGLDSEHKVSSGRAPASGVQTDHTVFNAGDPLVVLHGAGRRKPSHENHISGSKAASATARSARKQKPPKPRGRPTVAAPRRKTRLPTAAKWNDDTHAPPLFDLAARESAAVRQRQVEPVSPMAASRRGSDASGPGGSPRGRADETMELNDEEAERENRRRRWEQHLEKRRQQKWREKQRRLQLRRFLMGQDPGPGFRPPQRPRSKSKTGSHPPQAQRRPRHPDVPSRPTRSAPRRNADAGAQRNHAPTPSRTVPSQRQEPASSRIAVGACGGWGAPAVTVHPMEAPTSRPTSDAPSVRLPLRRRRPASAVDAARRHGRQEDAEDAGVPLGGTAASRRHLRVWTTDTAPRNPHSSRRGRTAPLPAPSHAMGVRFEQDASPAGAGARDETASWAETADPRNPLPFSVRAATANWSEAVQYALHPMHQGVPIAWDGSAAVPPEQLQQHVSHPSVFVGANGPPNGFVEWNQNETAGAAAEPSISPAVGVAGTPGLRDRERHSIPTQTTPMMPPGRRSSSPVQAVSSPNRQEKAREPTWSTVTRAQRLRRVVERSGDLRSVLRALQRVDETETQVAGKLLSGAYEGEREECASEGDWDEAWDRAESAAIRQTGVPLGPLMEAASRRQPDDSRDDWTGPTGPPSEHPAGTVAGSVAASGGRRASSRVQRNTWVDAQERWRALAARHNSPHVRGANAVSREQADVIWKYRREVQRRHALRQRDLPERGLAHEDVVDWLAASLLEDAVEELAETTEASLDDIARVVLDTA